MTVITLTTDFGEGAPKAGLLNGVIWSIAPQASVVELTHQVPRGDRTAVQMVLENAIPYFPEGTVHLAVINLSSGTTTSGPDTPLRASRPLVAHLGPMLFCGPDNGLITPLLERAEANRWKVEIYHANKPQYWRTAPLLDVTRDIYAPLAAHLALGVPPTELGEQISDPIRADIPAPEVLDDGWRGQVLQADFFGNLTSNIKRLHLEGMGHVQVTVAGRRIEGLSRTFGDGKPGDLIALIDSSNRLSVCIVNGSAAVQTGARPGDVVEVRQVRKSR